MLNTPTVRARDLCIAGVSVIIIAMVVTPLLSVPQYNWVAHTLSQLGGQNMPGAWLMNFGFWGYGMALVGASAFRWHHNRLTNAAVMIFGMGLVGASLFSALPVGPDLTGSSTEDHRHSFFAGITGFAFAAATASRIFAPGGSLKDILSWIGLIASVAIPLAMVQLPDLAGVLQRVMFAISFVWMLRYYRRYRR